MVEHKNVLIPWYPISYLTIASSGFFFGALTGPYPTLRFGGACGRGMGAFDLVLLASGPDGHLNGCTGYFSVMRK
jgi:hypothetical protein